MGKWLSSSEATSDSQNRQLANVAVSRLVEFLLTDSERVFSKHKSFRSI